MSMITKFWSEFSENHSHEIVTFVHVFSRSVTVTFCQISFFPFSDSRYNWFWGLEWTTIVDSLDTLNRKFSFGEPEVLYVTYRTAFASWSEGLALGFTDFCVVWVIASIETIIHHFGFDEIKIWVPYPFRMNISIRAWFFNLDGQGLSFNHISPFEVNQVIGVT